jgi:hypothetical protein
MKMAYVLLGAISISGAVAAAQSVASSAPPPSPAPAVAEGASVATPDFDHPHARTGGNPHAGIEATQSASTDPHRGIGAQSSSVEVKPTDRAKGPTGRTVAEVIGQRTALAGKTVRVHATVVKITPGVLGRTYLHLRDGSGDAAAGTNDVTVTTQATPVVGSQVVLEGVVALDRDIGSGYRFPTLIEDASVVEP